MDEHGNGALAIALPIGRHGKLPAIGLEPITLNEVTVTYNAIPFVYKADENEDSLQIDHPLKVVMLPFLAGL